MNSLAFFLLLLLCVCVFELVVKKNASFRQMAGLFKKRQLLDQEFIGMCGEVLYVLANPWPLIRCLIIPFFIFFMLCLVIPFFHSFPPGSAP